MSIVFFLLVFIFGLGVGSFLLVVLDRREREEGILGRSYCEVCKKMLRWYELVPVASYLFQGGKCRACRAKLSSQYPLLEIFTGGVFVVVSARVLASFGEEARDMFLLTSGTVHVAWLFATLLFALVIASLFILIFLYDLRHKIIPNAFSYTFSFLALFGFFVSFGFTGQSILSFSFLSHLLAGPILALPFALLWLVSKGTWMGLGDAKLTLGIGWLLGLTAGLTALIVGIWSGAIVGLLLIAVDKIWRKWGQHALPQEKNELTMKHELPFAPFLILGVVLVFLLEMNFFSGAYQIFILSSF